MRLYDHFLENLFLIFPLGRLALFVLLQSLLHGIVAHAFVLMDYFKVIRSLSINQLRRFAVVGGDHEQDIALT